MKLFKVILRGMNFISSGSGVANGYAYVVAENTDDAYKKVRAYLDTKELGFRHERELNCVELLAEEGDYPNCGLRLFL
jgi:hypothetical protein